MDSNQIEGTRSLDELLSSSGSQTRSFGNVNINIAEAKITITATRPLSGF